jgi:hypothetical protein
VKALPSLALAALLLTQGACTTLKSFSLTQVPADRSHRIEASASSGGLFGIFFSNSFVDELTEDLVKQCPGGRVTGILTKQESTLYVIWVSRKLVATGYCLPAAPAAFPLPPAPPAAPVLSMAPPPGGAPLPPPPPAPRAP